jgi:branched-chain amino acid transport system ATP-binding protein
MDLVFRFATRVIVMVGGAVLLDGTPQEIASDPRVRAVYLGKAAGETGRSGKGLSGEGSAGARRG